MTKEKLKERYKYIVQKKINDDITSIELFTSERQSITYYVRLLFAYGKLYYTGDMGSYIFGQNIDDIKTFFKGTKINPCYWAGKVECASYPIFPQDVDTDKVRILVKEHIRVNGISVSKEMKEQIDDDLNNLETNMYRAYDTVLKIFEELGIYDPSEEVGYIIEHSRGYDFNYLYACELLQWVENEIIKEAKQ